MQSPLWTLCWTVHTDHNHGMFINLLDFILPFCLLLFILLCSLTHSLTYLLDFLGRRGLMIWLDDWISIITTNRTDLIHTCTRFHYKFITLISLHHLHHHHLLFSILQLFCKELKEMNSDHNLNWDVAMSINY